MLRRTCAHAVAAFLGAIALNGVAADAGGLYVDVPGASILVAPHLSVGLAAATLDAADGTLHPSSFGATDVASAYQAIATATYALGELWSLRLEYRFTGTTESRGTELRGAWAAYPGEREHPTHNLLLRLILTFE